MLHVLQFYLYFYRDNEQHTYKNLLPGSEHVVSWPVHEKVTMELVIARSWGCIGDTEAEVTVYFRGVVPVPASLTITGGQRVSELIRVFAPLSATEVSPSGKLEKWLTVVKPTSNKILPLGERDRLPGDDRPIYQSVFEYDIDLTEAADVTCRWPGLQRSLYESQFVGQFFMIYNHKKSLVGVGDAWPKSTKLGKGKHTVRLQVRHTSTSTLEGLADMPLLLERTLKNPIALTFYPSQTEALAGGEKLSIRTIPIGNSTSFYLREPSYDSLPKTASPGDSFTGSVSYIKKNAYAIGNSQDKYPVKYVIADTKPKPASTTSTPTPAADTTTGTAVKTDVSPTEAAVSEYDKTIKEAKIKHLKSCIGDKKAFDSVFTLVSTDYSTEVTVQSCKPAHLEKLLQTEYTTANKLKIQNDTSNNSIISSEIDTLKRCIALCESIKLSTNSVITSIDQDAIALEYGRNLDKEDSAAGAKRKEVDIQKLALVEALFILSKTYLIWIASVERIEALSKLTPPITVETTILSSSDTSTSTPAPATTTESTEAITASEDVSVGKTTTPALIAKYQVTLKDLGKWVDLTTDEKYAPLQVGRNRLLGRHGLALKKVHELITSSEHKHTAETKEHYYQVISVHYLFLLVSLIFQR